MTQLVKDIKRNRNDEQLRCIVLSASAGKVFSAGHNLKELTKDSGTDFHKSVFAKASELMMEILKSPVPVIAKVDGLAGKENCLLDHNATEDLKLHFSCGRLPTYCRL